MIEFSGSAVRLSPGDIDAEAADLGCNPAVIRAVCDVEAAGSGFLPDGRPKILYEAHVFGRLTKHRWDHSHPNISAPSWDRSLYGAGGAHQYARLGQAIGLDRRAALQSASWGMFQVLGLNYSSCGYPDAESFVSAMVTCERAHLDAFTKFCLANQLEDELRAVPPNFESFTSVYNGTGQVAVYSTKLRAAWRKWLANPVANDNPAPRTAASKYFKTLQLNSFGEDVRRLQLRLIELGFDAAADRDFGPETMAAVVTFQKSRGLTPDGVVGRLTWGALSL